MIRPGETTLELLYDHDDFMESLRTVADMGAGSGQDAYWWATRTTRDDDPIPLNIKVLAVDKSWEGHQRPNHKNIRWLTTDFSETGIDPNSVDLVWCHDALQLSTNPIATLSHWHSIMRPDAMLCLTLPNNQRMRQFRDFQRIDNIIQPGSYYNFSPASLILLLASCGFDCRYSHFKFEIDGKWLHAAVYKSEHLPQAQMNWYELLDKKLLPESAEKAILARGYLRDSDLKVEWIDHEIYVLDM